MGARTSDFFYFTKNQNLKQEFFFRDKVWGGMDRARVSNFFLQARGEGVYSK